MPRTNGIVFEFDQPMDTSVNLQPSFPPFFAGNLEVRSAGMPLFFAWEWSEDGLTLTGTPILGELPPGSLVTWTLNPSGGGETPLTNESGVPLPATGGSFTTAGEGPGGGEDDDCDEIPDTWGAYSISKGIRYEQTSSSDPVPEADAPYTFGAFVGNPVAGPDMTEGSVTLPGGTTLSLNTVPFGGNLFFLSTPPSDELLESTYPGGNYTLRFTQTGQPERVVSMNLPVNDVPLPKIANFVEAQSIDETSDFTLRWNQFTGGASDRYLSVTVVDDLQGDVVFQAPDHCLPRELPVSATSVVIPANTLSPNRTYEGTLAFTKSGYTSTNDVPEMAGSATVAKITVFTLRTGSVGTAAPATLSDARVLPNGNPEMSLSGTSGWNYTVERAGSLTNPNWMSVGIVTLDGSGAGRFEDTTGGASFPRFYRAVAD